MPFEKSNPEAEKKMLEKSKNIEGLYFDLTIDNTPVPWLLKGKNNWFYKTYNEIQKSYREFTLTTKIIDKKTGETDEVVSVLKGVWINEKYLYLSSEIDAAFIADGISGDFYEAVARLEESGEYIDVFLDDCLDVFYTPLLLYVKTFFVLPEYRKKGIGEAILNNLPKILEDAFEVSPRYTCILCQPQEICNRNGIIDVGKDIENSNMLNAMIRLIKKCGYEKIPKQTENYFYLKKEQ